MHVPKVPDRKLLTLHHVVSLLIKLSKPLTSVKVDFLKLLTYLMLLLIMCFDVVGFHSHEEGGFWEN